MLANPASSMELACKIGLRNSISLFVRTTVSLSLIIPCWLLGFYGWYFKRNNDVVLLCALSTGWRSNWIKVWQIFFAFNVLKNLTAWLVNPGLICLPLQYCPKPCWLLNLFLLVDRPARPYLSRFSPSYLVKLRFSSSLQVNYLGLFPFIDVTVACLASNLILGRLD